MTEISLLGYTYDFRYNYVACDPPQQENSPW